MAKIAGMKVAQAASDAGFTGDLLVTMVAIARAESSWDPKAHNDRPPDDSYGLWQINMLGALGPERRKQLNLHDNAELFSPATNARAAKLIHKQQGTKAWSTFTHGTYKSHLAKAKEAVAALPGGGGAGPKPTPKPVPKPKPGVYVAKKGDTLAVIARRALGATSLWLPLYEVNRAVIGPNPNKLTPGTSLRLPAIYTIREGDSLSAIAKRLLSKASEWHLIYQLNKAAIGPDPNKLKPGAKLALP
jgi:nucleoid-associated protein YgaU